MWLRGRPGAVSEPDAPVGSPLACEVSALAHGGAGVARVEGRVVFVDGALPGERVLVEVTDSSRDSWWRGRVLEVLAPSPGRTTVSCPAAAAGAGCCDLAFGTAAEIRRAKTTILTDALTRIGRIAPPADLAVEPIPGGESGHRWRIRARLGVDAKRSAIGFRAARGTAIIAAPCAALTADLADAVAGLDAAALRPGAEVLAVHDDVGVVHLAELSGGAVAARSGGGGARATAQRRRSRPGVAPRVLAGGPTARYRIGERVWDVPLDGFWQAHRGAAPVYAGTAAQWLAPWLSGATVWDLYGGAGVFAAAAVDGGAQDVRIVDSAAAALAAARTVLEGTPVRTRHSAVTAAVLAELPEPDVVVLDPPRSGAGHAVVDAVVAAGPAAIVHVGCDPAAFARDLGRAVAAGYRLARVRGFDAFPLTHHVEAMALLVRG